jgi:tetratricopeptide (TPR) repeat protein
VLGFEPAAADRDGREHRIEVRVHDRPRTTVRHRLSFHAEPVAVAATARPKAAPPPAPASTWDDAARRRAAMGLPPFTWWAEWLAAGTRFCTANRVDAELAYVGGWDETRLRDVRSWLDNAWDRRDGFSTPTWFEPAAMRRAAALHTIGFFHEAAKGDRLPDLAHLELAGSLLLHSDASVSAAGRMHVDWVMVTAKWLWRIARLRDARALARSALSQHRDDARLHGLAGMLQELAASPLAHPGVLVETLARRHHGVRTALLQAEKDYRNALALDPAQAEARLRLGRVLDLLDQPRRADAEYARVLESDADPPTRWLAHMFRGQAYQRTGRHADAVSSYQRALEIQASQTVVLALAQALEANGDRDGALARLRTLDGHEPDDCPEGCDPWQTYDNPDPATINAQVQALVARACGEAP